MISSSRVFRQLQIVYCALVLAFLLAPVLVVIPMAFSSSRYLTFPPPGFSLQYFNEILFGEIERVGGKAAKNWLGALGNTVMIGLATSAIATALGTSAAIGLVRGRFPGKALISALLISPMIIPLIITAVGMFFLYVQMNLIGTFTGMVIAHTVLASPFVVVVVSATLHGVDPSLERAAMGLGASAARAFLTVTLPIIAPGVMTGALFAFITSFDEVVVALFLSGSNYRTLPVQMFEGLRFEIDPAISAVGTLMVSVAMLALGAALALRRGARNLGRRANSASARPTT